MTLATFALYSSVLQWEEGDNLIAIWFVFFRVQQERLKGAHFLFPQASLTLRFWKEFGDETECYRSY